MVLVVVVSSCGIEDKKGYQKSAMGLCRLMSLTTPPTHCTGNLLPSFLLNVNHRVNRQVVKLGAGHIGKKALSPIYSGRG